jgi:hypothetical protein
MSKKKDEKSSLEKENAANAIRTKTSEEMERFL